MSGHLKKVKQKLKYATQTNTTQDRTQSGHNRFEEGQHIEVGELAG
jgi:hypothetical protein